jgi:hypothetical protein
MTYFKRKLPYAWIVFFILTVAATLGFAAASAIAEDKDPLYSFTVVEWRLLIEKPDGSVAAIALTPATYSFGVGNTLCTVSKNVVHEGFHGRELMCDTESKTAVYAAAGCFEGSDNTYTEGLRIKLAKGKAARVSLICRAVRIPLGDGAL